MHKQEAASGTTKTDRHGVMVNSESLANLRSGKANVASFPFESLGKDIKENGIDTV